MSGILFTTSRTIPYASDPQSVLGWPESEQVEFKEALPGDNANAQWVNRNKIIDAAKAGLLKEVVAFANTAGGHVLLGFTETASGHRRLSG